ncbi:hydroxysqualene dehydroxylase HpnE [Actinomadura viridis]|uniref:Squalene-associated FAD-dependent desaturase n=1 Tax=Actinomadura viridis TaxID=58110 RepID=A0A931DR17_9ACTN|nr:hydroxysqualene dehydroxylase HpnE [Actinomadura viridis]MBG6091815.1 squalene-associated FAD-dependent desaturase [Actinomadura viridis]
MSVAIVGGGLAGISAALALQEAGHEVTLYEGRAWLGGATHSFRRGDLWIDNGQHVFLKCCTAYRELLRRLGTAGGTRLQDRFDVTVLGPDGRRGRLRRAALPGPAHLVPALAGYGLLSPADRLRAVRAALALRFLDHRDPAVDSLSAGRWLAGHGQGERAVRDLWGLLITASLNADPEEASLAPAAMVLRTALLGRADAADIGVPTVPLRDLHGRAALAAIRAGGGRVRLKAKVEAVEPGPKVLVDGALEPADAVVVAVPHRAAATLVPEAACPQRHAWAGLGRSPIINVHVVYDRAVMAEPFAAATGSPAQWIFDRTPAGGPASGQYLAVSVSAADRWAGLPAAELRRLFLPELARLLPRARGARVDDFFVTRERHATFRQRPGTAALRPPAVTRLPGIFLAGAWTDTGWPDTMEGAVRSGLTAAREVRGHLRHRARGVAAR